MLFVMLPADTIQELREQARHSVRGGYEQLEEIVDALVELVEFDPETQDLVASDRSRAVAEVGAIVAEENSSYLVEAATWPPQTDCDRITAVFADLERNGIAARENVGYTQGDLAVEMSEIVAELAKVGHSMRGWVGFHSQDIESAVDGRGLHLGFAPVDRKNKGAWVEIGAEIVEAFKLAGFKVTWNGKANERPHLAVDWKRRRSPRHA